MKRKVGVAAVLITVSATLASAQAPPVSQNTWTSGAPMPTPLGWTVTGVIEGYTVLAGGATGLYVDGTSTAAG